MWLDRFSHHTTSNGSPAPLQARSSSAAPRRSMQLAPSMPNRPHLTPRTSSLSDSTRANTSTISLPAGTRSTNGSTLRHELSRPSNIEDPIDVLERILGSKLIRHAGGNEDAQALASAPKPDDLDRDIEFGELSLSEYLQQNAVPVEVQSHAPSSMTEEYAQDKVKLEELHRSAIACDDVLKSVEISLTNFQRDLGVVSAEIETLQNRSTILNTRLENRKIVETLLGPAVEEISISPMVVRIISEGPINEEWQKALGELEKRASLIDSRTKTATPSKAALEMKPLVDNLIMKAIERIRDFFVVQIKTLRSPSINSQVIQQQSLVKYRDLYTFLAKHHIQLAEEIGQAYINTMRWYYFSCFTRYRHALDKMLLFHVDRSETVGADPAMRNARQNTNRQHQGAHDALSIGRRAEILRSASYAALPSYLAEESKSYTYIETPFRHFNLALVDNVTFEYSFLTAFFSPTSSFHQLSRRFAEIFEPTFTLGQSLTKELIEPTYDCLGILLCVRLNQAFAFELQRRKIPVAENYLNATNILLWPRFQVVMDAHSESVKHLASGLSTARSGAPTAAAKLIFAGTSSGDSSKQSTAPHSLTQRFGQFLHGILTISKEAGDDEPVANSLGRLRTEYEAFLAKASRSAGSETVKRERFLANNYALILTIVEGAEGKLAGEMRRHFEGLRDDLKG
ncbi:hypothetical protein MMC25_007157 [Agyrium rufum]|nr:hypothetical protein [Agyrium rufum]